MFTTCWESPLLTCSMWTNNGCEPAGRSWAVEHRRPERGQIAEQRNESRVGRFVHVVEMRRIVVTGPVGVRPSCSINGVRRGHFERCVQQSLPTGHRGRATKPSRRARASRGWRSPWRR